MAKACKAGLVPQHARLIMKWKEVRQRLINSVESRASSAAGQINSPVSNAATAVPSQLLSKAIDILPVETSEVSASGARSGMGSRSWSANGAVGAAVTWEASGRLLQRSAMLYKLVDPRKPGWFESLTDVIQGANERIKLFGVCRKVHSVPGTLTDLEEVRVVATNQEEPSIPSRRVVIYQLEGEAIHEEAHSAAETMNETRYGTDSERYFKSGIVQLSQLKQYPHPDPYFHLSPRCRKDQKQLEQRFRHEVCKPWLKENRLKAVSRSGWENAT
ncbi:hypothetical protein PSPO01_15853 [Paraphaeosphaeria sporulosa]